MLGKRGFSTLDICVAIGEATALILIEHLQTLLGESCKLQVHCFWETSILSQSHEHVQVDNHTTLSLLVLQHLPSADISRQYQQCLPNDHDFDTSALPGLGSKQSLIPQKVMSRLTSILPLLAQVVTLTHQSCKDSCTEQ